MSNFDNYVLMDGGMFDERQQDGSKLRAVRHNDKVEFLQVFQSGYVIEGNIRPIKYKTFLQKMQEFKSLKYAFWTSKKDQANLKRLGFI